MLKNDGELILYHDSFCEVSKPDLTRCAKYEDFGQGFYLTTSEEQAQRFSRTALKKAIANGITDGQQDYGIVSVFNCPIEEWNSLKICHFETADESWLNCVVAHRRRETVVQSLMQYTNYDVIGGKIANDATNATITAYMAGIYGTVGSQRAAQLCISLLLPERLKDQYCFRSQRSIDALHFVRSYQVWK